MAIFVHDMAYIWHICPVLYNKNSVTPLGTLDKAKPKFAWHLLLKTLSHVAWEAQATLWSLLVDDSSLCSLIGNVYNKFFHHYCHISIK